MRSHLAWSILFSLAGLLICDPAAAQKEAPKPYAKVAVTLPEPVTDPDFDTFREQLTLATEAKDRKALAALVVSSEFFWERQSGQSADDKKSGIDNLAAVTDLDAKEGSGWDFIAEHAAEATASPVLGHKDALCSPGNPSFDEKELADVVRSTGSTPLEWGFPLGEGIEVRATTNAESDVVETLEMTFVRVLIDDLPPDSEDDPQLKVATPSGKVGYVPADVIAPLAIDQLCYIKQGGSWKIAGYIGEGAAK